MIFVSVSSNLHQFVGYAGCLTIRILRSQPEFWMSCRQPLPNHITCGARFEFPSAVSFWPLGSVESECPADNASRGQAQAPNAHTAPLHSSPVQFGGGSSM